MTLWNAFACHIIKYLSALAFYRASYLNTHMILSVIPGDCTITIVLAFISLLIEPLIVFALVFEVRKGRRSTLFL